MLATLSTLPPELREEIYCYCCVKDWINVACCSKECYETVKYLLWGQLQVQWKLLECESEVKEKTKYLYLTTDLCMYVNCQDISTGNETPMNAAFTYIINNCDPSKLSCLEFHRYIVSNGLKVVSEVLTELKELSMTDIDIPEEDEWKRICNLTKLSTLSLFSCNICDSGLTDAYKLSNLKEVTIERCLQLTDVTLHNISQLDGLRKLTYSNSGDISASNDDVDLLLRLPNLEELNVSLNTISDSYFLNVNQRLCNIKVLDVAYCRNLTDAALSHISKLPHLRELDISGINCSDDGLYLLSQSVTLDDLTLHECENITDTALHYISKMVSLKSIDVSSCVNITDQSLLYLSMSKSLTSLVTGDCKNITDLGLAHASKLSMLTKLYTRGCIEISDDGISNVSKLLSLKHLTIAGCEKVTDRALSYIQNLRFLEDLNVTCCNITDSGLAVISELSLLELDISHCVNITDTGVSYLTRLRTLRSLDLFGCSKLTDDALLHIARILSLIELDISYCINTTDIGIKHISMLPLLKFLSVAGCEGISDTGLLQMSKFVSIRKSCVVE